MLVGNPVACLPGKRISNSGTGVRLDKGGGRGRSGVVERKKGMTRVWAFALMLASGANTASAARVPAAMGPVTEIPLPLDLRVLRRADGKMTERFGFSVSV